MNKPGETVGVPAAGRLEEIQRRLTLIAVHSKVGQAVERAALKLAEVKSANAQEVVA